MENNSIQEYFNFGVDKSKGAISRYCALFKYAILARVENNPNFDFDNVLNSANACLQWLETAGFFKGPASTRFHEAYEGGLCEHSLKVAERILELHTCEAFKNVPLYSAILVALVHDWCKIGQYESYQKNVKDSSGNWVKETAFKTSDNLKSSLGHGVSSMYLISKWVVLTTDEANAIRWHMGAWRVADSETGELQFANETYPLVHMLQFADQLSIVKY